MKKIGVMGCGVVASYGHLPAIAATNGLEIAALYDPDPARVNELGSHYPNAWRFIDPEAFFQADLDAVVVASPAPAHSENVRLAAKHGKHVLCEKPLAMSEAEAEAMIALMESAGLMLFTGFCYRFSPVALNIQQLVEQGAIGEVRSLRLIYIWNLDGKYQWSDGQRIQNPRRVARMIEGGPMVDCGVHAIDLSRWWLSSEVVRQQGIGAWVEEFEAPDHMYLHMDHAGGAHTMVEMSFSYCATAKDPINHFSYHLIGSDGLIRYDRDGWHFESRSSQATHYYHGASEKNFEGMYQAFLQALETGDTGHLPSGHDGVIATRIARLATEEAIAHRLGRIEK